MVHNAYFKGDTIFMAHYRAGIIALDVSNLPAQPVVIGYYDTYPGFGTAYQGAWNVYPFYNSGKFIGSDIATGLYVLKFGDPIGINTHNSNTPTELYLSQNFPNPFNPETKIKYEIPKNSYITLKVYDLTGKEIYSLNQFKLAGSYEFNFDGSNLPSGLYFYSLEANGNKEVKKMVLLK
jgi:hypothetical protein